MTACTQGLGEAGLECPLVPGKDATGSPSSTSDHLCIPSAGTSYLLVRRQEKEKHWEF